MKENVSCETQLFNLINFRPSTQSLRMIKDGKIALLCSRLYVRSNKYRNDVFGLTRSMFANHLEMIVERGFPLLRRINEVLSTLRDAGLMNKMFIDFNYNMTILTPIREKQHHLKEQDDGNVEDLNIDDGHINVEDDPEIVLTTEHLEGAFTLLFVGLAVSSAVFILEMIFHSKFVRNVLRWVCKTICCYKRSKPIKSVGQSKVKNSVKKFA